MVTRIPAPARSAVDVRDVVARLLDGAPADPTDVADRLLAALAAAGLAVRPEGGMRLPA